MSGRNGRTASRQQSPLDCSQPLNAIFWFLLGVAIAIGAMAAECKGDWSALLRVGSTNPMRLQIERELGPVVSPDPVGHDGQLYYLVARDPFAQRLNSDIRRSVYLDRPAYRYRRVLLPLLAGGFGQFSGRATLWGMIVLTAIGFGLATAAIADLAFQKGVAGAAVVAAAANAGAILGAVMLTVDTLALGLALTGVALAARGRLAFAAAALASAALTKETYVLAGLSVALWVWRAGDRRIGLLLVSATVAPLALWSAWLRIALPESAAGLENFSLPLAGWVESVKLWFTEEPDLMEVAYGVLASVILFASIVSLGRRDRLLRYVAAPWVALAICSSIVVWGKPNNAIRAFAILWPIAVLALSGTPSSAIRGRARTARAHAGRH